MHSRPPRYQKNKHLTRQERNTVLNLHNEGLHPKKVLDAIGRSSDAIYSITWNLANTSVAPRSGRPSSISAAEGIVLRDDLKRISTARQIRSNFELPNSLSMIRKSWVLNLICAKKGSMECQPRQRTIKQDVVNGKIPILAVLRCNATDEKRFMLKGPNAQA